MPEPLKEKLAALLVPGAIGWLRAETARASRSKRWRKSGLLER